MKTSIKVILVCRNASGEIELFKGSSQVNKKEREEGLHLQNVGDLARVNEYEVIAAFDQDDPASKQLLDMAQFVNPVFDPRIDMDAILKGYLVAMLWTATDNIGDPMDQTYTVDDLGEDVRSQAKEMIEAFVSAQQVQCVVYADLLQHVVHRGQGTSYEYLGHDIYLSSNGHGAGFLDRNELPHGTRQSLDQEARDLGELSLYQDDDGNLYTE